MKTDFLTINSCCLRSAVYFGPEERLAGLFVVVFENVEFFGVFTDFFGDFVIFDTLIHSVPDRQELET